MHGKDALQELLKASREREPLDTLGNHFSKADMPLSECVVQAGEMLAR